jgi:hypothetical protein
MGGYTGPRGFLGFGTFEFSGSLCLVASVFFMPELGFLLFVFKKDVPRGLTAMNELPLAWKPCQVLETYIFLYLGGIGHTAMNVLPLAWKPCQVSGKSILLCPGGVCFLEQKMAPTLSEIFKRSQAFLLCWFTRLLHCQRYSNVHRPFSSAGSHGYNPQQQESMLPIHGSTRM